jgi:hypothetical protein
MWAGPAQLTRSDSAQKGWADLTVLSASSGLSRTRPRHHSWAKTGLAQCVKTGRGIIFPPHPQELIPKMK